MDFVVLNIRREQSNAVFKQKRKIELAIRTFAMLHRKRCTCALSVNRIGHKIVPVF